MAIQHDRPLVTVEEYLRAERVAETRSEYISGRIHAMAGGTRTHSALAARVVRAVGNRLEDRSCEVFGSDAGIRVSDTEYQYPDVSVSCDSRDLEPGMWLRFPVAVFEVLSDSTEGLDRGARFARYRTMESLREYVLISQRSPAVEVYRREADFWVLHEFGPEDDVLLDSLGLSFPVADLYANLQLEA